MKTPDSFHGGRDRSSGTPSQTPDRRVQISAARSLKGVFLACFTSSEPINSSELCSPPAESSGGSSEKRHRSIYGSSNDSTHLRDPGTTKFTIGEILQATRNFSPNLKIGHGGFGTVYKGRLEDGTFVAVKRATKSVHDRHLGLEFQSEIVTLKQVEHLNLVKFYGYLIHEDEKLVVVEYVPNGTLREHLEVLCINAGMHGAVLDFAKRLDVATDVAHAVTYLHMYSDHPIIHRDIKSSNILLTENFRAKVADFGFARIVADGESDATHISTQVKGTAGYLDPEYLTTFQLTEKSDVYSFGVLLVELMTGRRPIEPKRELKEKITARWAMKKFTEGDAILVLDPRLERSPANNVALEKILELALQCLAPHKKSRPRMRRCAEVLWSIRKEYRQILGSETPSISSDSQRSTSLKEE
ncbi:calmodulin-binding receptor-like cytoplasmic kinase 2 isoform X2 [Daucus carota subsp. sativus]|uniref:calmodulin-binding receptor-like cytoplasmic kinase 2 isoform X2 n=1 Tax=Daucus carota subsp. sativus TaxID=79200 RepID=UPI003082D4FA